jgi:hypothetical protein
MKDNQGNTRSNCILDDCICVEYLLPKKDELYKCDYCGHLPNQHKLVVTSPPPSTKQAEIQQESNKQQENTSSPSLKAENSNSNTTSTTTTSSSSYSAPPRPVQKEVGRFLLL